MLQVGEAMQLLPRLGWLLAGVGVFIVGMNFLSDGLEKRAGRGMKGLLERIGEGRLAGVGIGAGVTALVQSSSATSVMVIGLVNAGVMSLAQATPIIMGANVGTTVTGVLVALKNDVFQTAMYFLTFAGVVMGFLKREGARMVGGMLLGLGLIFVGLSIMSSEQAFGNPLVEQAFAGMLAAVDFPPLLVLIGAAFTALIQSSSAATGVVVTMVGTGVLPLELALFIVLGANVGTCITAQLAAVGANANAKRVALIHLAFNLIGTVLFTAGIWLFRGATVDLLVALFPGEDPTALQMRVSIFHVIFNVTTTLLLLPFVNRLVRFSCGIIREDRPPAAETASPTLHFVDDRLLSTPSVALMQVKREILRMMALAEENIRLSFTALEEGSSAREASVRRNEAEVDFINSELTKFLIRLSSRVEPRDERIIGEYFHVLNDLERIGDHAENFHEIGVEMAGRQILFSAEAMEELAAVRERIHRMFAVAGDALARRDRGRLAELTALEEEVDVQRAALMAGHFARLAEGSCHVDGSPYYTSVVLGLERVADHLVNVGYSIVNPIGAQGQGD